MRKEMIVIIFVIALSLSACTNEKKLQEESTVSVEDISDNEVYDKGYNLPVKENEKEEAESECLQMMQKIERIYLECDKGTASNVHISDETSLKMFDILKEENYPIYHYSDKGMSNYDKMENFLKQSLNGQKGKIVCYDINSEGGVGRNKFVFDGKDMYLLYTNCTWSEDNEPVIGENFYNRIKEWEYTSKGWFCYELCTPGPLELTEVVDGNCMIRIKPIEKEFNEITSKYLMPLG